MCVNHGWVFIWRFHGHNIDIDMILRWMTKKGRYGRVIRHLQIAIPWLGTSGGREAQIRKHPVTTVSGPSRNAQLLGISYYSHTTVTYCTTILCTALFLFWSSQCKWTDPQTDTISK